MALTSNNSKNIIHFITDDDVLVHHSEGEGTAVGTTGSALPIVPSESSSPSLLGSASLLPMLAEGNETVILVDHDVRVYTFVRILLKYLESKHPFLYLRAKAIVLDCAVLKKQEQIFYGANYKPRKTTLQLVNRLRGIVTEQQWILADHYTYLFLKCKDNFSENPVRRRGRRRCMAPPRIVEP